VSSDEILGPGFCGETWLPFGRARVRGGQGEEEAGGQEKQLRKPVPGKDGVLVPPKAGDALVFFSFKEVFVLPCPRLARVRFHLETEARVKRAGCMV
jgi:hypothetical protein